MINARVKSKQVKWEKAAIGGEKEGSRGGECAKGSYSW